MTLDMTDWDDWAKVHLTRTPPRNREEMQEAMSRCEQTQGQTVLEHGQSVHKCLKDLLSHMRGVYELPEGQWRLPNWITDYKEFLLQNVHHEGRLEAYTVNHDCGKPYCCHVDKNTGQRHFPNHAEVSSYIWACVGGNDAVRLLIADDMVIHTATADQITEHLTGRWSKQDSVTLLLAALAEIHSNAKMFGGVESTNFKMKWKTVDKRGRQICKHWLPKAQTVEVKG